MEYENGPDKEWSVQRYGGRPADNSGEPPAKQKPWGEVYTWSKCQRGGHTHAREDFIVQYNMGSLQYGAR